MDSSEYVFCDLFVLLISENDVGDSGTLYFGFAARALSSSFCFVYFPFDLSSRDSGHTDEGETVMYSSVLYCQRSLKKSR